MIRMLEQCSFVFRLSAVSKIKFNFDIRLSIKDTTIKARVLIERKPKINRISKSIYIKLSSCVLAIIFYSYDL